MITSLGENDKAYMSYYADRIGASLVENVQLTSLVIYPIKEMEKRSRRDEYVFQNNSIQISGVCASAQYLNSWFSVLGEDSYISEIKNQYYKFNNYENVGHFSFELIVNKP